MNNSDSIDDEPPHIEKPIDQTQEMQRPDAALRLLCKWHNWIATGQLNFTNEHLAESGALLKAAGLPCIEQIVPPGD